METEEFYGELTIQHFIPEVVDPETLLNSWRRCSGFGGMAAIEFTGKVSHTHHALIFWKSDFPTDLAQEELASFISGYVAAWQDCRKPVREGGLVFVPFDDEAAEDKLPNFKLCPDPLGEPADWDEPLILSDDDAAPLGWDSVDTSTDDSPQMMPGPDQFR